jgi:hypothetical protein
MFDMMLKCVSITPLGSPVLPLEKMTVASSIHRAPALTAAPRWLPGLCDRPGFTRCGASARFSNADRHEPRQRQRGQFSR